MHFKNSGVGVSILASDFFMRNNYLDDESQRIDICIMVSGLIVFPI